MMLKFVSKFVLEILPSVTATVIGAYIVNHYIISKPANPPAAARAAMAAASICSRPRRLRWSIAACRTTSPRAAAQ